METLIDDVGSFPLPRYTNRKSFIRAYAIAREVVISGKDVRKDAFLLNNFYRVVIDSFRKKRDTGLDVVNYPQHYDMNKQFTDVIHKAMGEGTYIVREKDAIIPEVYVINKEAKRLYEDTGSRVSLRVCITGPMELYLKEIGITPYRDILLMFAETARRFAINSILNSKYIRTEVVALDEPSFGFRDVIADIDMLLDVLEKAFDFKGVIKHIHLHSPSKVPDLLDVKNLDALSIEYAASPKNIESTSKNMLDKADKQIRVGVSRTDVDSITAELYEKGIAKPTAQQLVETEETIRKRFISAKKKYGETMTFAGPDCGLVSWPTQAAAQLLLKRTVNAAKSAKTSLS